MASKPGAFFYEDHPWRLVKDFRQPWTLRGKRTLPFLEGVCIHTTLEALRKMKLITYFPETQQLYIKPKGMDVILETRQP